MQDSIISLAMSFNLWLRCEANSGSGQCRSLMNDWRASNFQNRSSEVAQPLLKREIKEVGLINKLVSMNYCLQKNNNIQSAKKQ